MSSNINITNKISIQDEGSSITANVKNINFIGSGVTATAFGDDVTVSITGGGGGASISLTTLGTSGLATLTGTILNIPQYIGLTDLTASSPLVYDNTLGIFSITQASAIDDGYLSSGDWINFNSKQNALSGGVTNQVTKWTGTGTIGNSIMTDTGTLMGISQTAPTAKLHINNTTASNSFLVEDDTNPDGTPFVIDNAGNVGIGNLTPATLGKLVVASTGTNGLVLDSDTGATANSTRLFFRSSTANKDLSIFNVAGAFRYVFGGSANVSSGSTKFIMNETGNMLFNATGATITPVAPITAYATAIAGSAEEIARFSVYSLTTPGTTLGSTLSLRNGTNTDEEFLPQVRGTQSTTSPLSALQIDALIANTQDIAGNTNPAIIVRAADTSGASLDFRPLLDIRNGGTSAVTVLPGPLVGINNNNPQYPLDILGNGGMRVADVVDPTYHMALDPSVFFNTNTFYSRHDPAFPGDFIINATSDVANNLTTGKFKLQTFGQDAITIDNAQNVGIGTTTPAVKLTINGPVSLLNYLYYNYTGGANNDYIGSNDASHPGSGNTTGFYLFKHDKTINITAETSNSTLDAGSIWLNTATDLNYIAGNLGLGTKTPSTKLHIDSVTSGAFRLVDTTQGANKYLKSDATGVGTWSTLTVADTGLTLTVTGTSGAATLVGNTLNIPQYTGGATLAQTLLVGNSAGTTDINMNNNDITNITNVSTSSTTLEMQAVLNSALIFYANNC
jgi:hypothetical protein